MRRALVVVAVLVMVVARGEVFAEQSITIATHWTPSDVGHYRILQDAVDEYMKLNPGVLIDIVASRSGSSVLWEMFLVQTAAGTPPDLMQLHTDYIAEYYPAFQPVPRMITELMRQMFYPAALEMVTIEGEYRAIPTEFQVKGVVHNQVMFAEAGVAPLTADPISWDQFWDTAAKLTRVDPDGQVRQSGFAYGEAQHFRTMLVADGYDVITADGDPLLNSPQMLRLVTQWKERVDQGIIAREESWPQGSWHDIHQRRSAMIIMPPWIRDTLVTSDPDGYFANNYVSTPVPYGALGVPRLRVYGWGWVVPNVARNPELAWDFLIWLNFNVQESGTTRMGDVMAAPGIASRHLRRFSAPAEHDRAVHARLYESA